jgi:integrase
MYHFGIRHQILQRHFTNPFSAAGLGKLRIRDAKPIFVFTAEQELSFLEAACQWQFPIQFLLAKTGIRSGELAKLIKIWKIEHHFTTKKLIKITVIRLKLKVGRW